MEWHLVELEPVRTGMAIRVFSYSAQLVRLLMDYNEYAYGASGRERYAKIWRSSISLIVKEGK